VLHGAPRPRILLAEGSASLRTAIGAALRAEGYDVVEARDGLELLGNLESAARGREGVVVVAAVDLDKLTGMDVLAALDCLSWTIPVILLAEAGDTDADVEGRELGARAVLHLPLDLGRLRDTLTGAISPGFAGIGGGRGADEGDA
jgi:DNA-binding response OmpR family regulator